MENRLITDNEIKTAVFALWARFKETMFARLAAVEQAGNAALEASLSNERRRVAEEISHKLAGSLGTFGLGEGSKLASELETMFRGETPFGPEKIRRLQELTEMLRTEMQRGPSPPAKT